MGLISRAVALAAAIVVAAAVHFASADAGGAKTSKPQVIAIATGSTAPHNDIPLNTFHPVAASIGTSISGFAAPIGGYQLSPLGATTTPTAEPLWMQLRKAGRKVVTATWPGTESADISIAGTLVQAAVPARTTDYTLPFGAFGGLGAQGFSLNAGSFVAADATLN